jgi:prepilin-type N-terminal cleavage/methylation domain-containing protein
MKGTGILRFKIPERGFTLVEIMIVVAIIGILVAVGVPNFMRVRMDANEGTIRADLRAFSTANESYRAFLNPPSYSPDVNTLVNQSYIDSSWLDPGTKHGYGFVYAVADNSQTYAIEANPLTPGTTGVHSYCVDQSGVLVRGAAAGLATPVGCVGGTPLGS